MGVSKLQAQENRRAIVAAATRLFRERGVEAVGLSELMKAAGFTQGGFYNHFDSKAALVVEVIFSAMQAGNAELVQSIRTPLDKKLTALERYISHYLSEEHRDNIEAGCPIAGFAGDAARLELEAQAPFARGVDDMVTIVAGMIAESGLIPDDNERKSLRERSIRLYCELVGSLVLSRSVSRASPTLGAEILDSSRRGFAAALR